MDEVHVCMYELDGRCMPRSRDDLSWYLASFLPCYTHNTADPLLEILDYTTITALFILNKPHGYQFNSG